MASTEGSENVTLQFTKEDIQALLNDEPITTKSDVKGELEYMTQQNWRLKLCVKWLQQVDETHLLELERLRNSVESAEKKCMDTELEMEKKLGELIEIFGQSREKYSDLRKELAKQNKMMGAAVKCYTMEREAIINLGKATREIGCSSPGFSKMSSRRTS